MADPVLPPADPAVARELWREPGAMPPWQAHAFFWIAAGFTTFHIVVLNLYPIDPLLFRALHLAWGSIIGFALISRRARDVARGVPALDWSLIGLAAGAALYIWIELDELQFRAGAMYTMGDFAVGAIGTLLVLEITRRTSGLALPILAVVFVLYAMLGPLLPGIWHHRGYAIGFILSYLYSDQGIFGITAAVSSTYVVLFVAFAAFLRASRAGDYFNDIAIIAVGWARGGPAKVAVISGILFGTISGSAVANVVASGMITIPMMRRAGYDASTAAAIEATSSTGGQITPPIMGAGAFIMAEVLGVAYTDIAIAVIVPTLLFYLVNYIHCDLHAVRNGLRGVPRAERPEAGRLLRRIHLFVPLVVLIAALLAGYSVFRAGTIGLASAIVASWLSARGERMGPRAMCEALAAAARDSVQLVAVCACAGIIVGIIALTGLAGRFAAVVLAIAGDSAFLALVFAMLISLILGMGMPTTAAYAVAASVVAPGLVRLGIAPLIAHLFIFYYAVISAITPPVALASFAAAGMAGADPWRTSWIALKLGLAAIIVPFMFVYAPEILLIGESWRIAQIVLAACIGVFLFASAIEGWYAGCPLALVPRVVLLAFAACLIVPAPVANIIGAAGGTAIWFWQRRGAASRSPT